MTTEKNIDYQKNDFFESNMELLKKYHTKIFKDISNFVKFYKTTEFIESEQSEQFKQSEKLEQSEESEKPEKYCDSEIFYTSQGKTN